MNLDFRVFENACCFVYGINVDFDRIDAPVSLGPLGFHFFFFSFHLSFPYFLGYFSLFFLFLFLFFF